jgi:hypothetical protein
MHILDRSKIDAKRMHSVLTALQAAAAREGLEVSTLAKAMLGALPPSAMRALRALRHLQLEESARRWQGADVVLRHLKKAAGAAEKVEGISEDGARALLRLENILRASAVLPWFGATAELQTIKKQGGLATRKPVSELTTLKRTELFGAIERAVFRAAYRQLRRDQRFINSISYSTNTTSSRTSLSTRSPSGSSCLVA